MAVYEEYLYGMVASSGGAYRRTHHVTTPNQKSQWRESVPISRPVEDWIEENVRVEPDPEYLKTTGQSPVQPEWIKTHRHQPSVDDVKRERRREYNRLARERRKERERLRYEEQERLKNDPVYQEQKRQELEQYQQVRRERWQSTWGRFSSLSAESMSFGFKERDEKAREEQLLTEFAGIVVRAIERGGTNLSMIQRHIHTFCIQFSQKSKVFAESGGIIIPLTGGNRLVVTWDDQLAYVAFNPFDFRQDKSNG